MKQFERRTSFSVLIKPVISTERDKKLALASVNELKDFVPNVDTTVNSDLLAFAGNACVVNRFNKNDDGIDTATAIEIYKNFVHKPINIEHDRNNNIGVILTVGFSEFGTDKPLTLEDVKDKTDPFNIVVGGILWRTGHASLVNFIEDSGDPASDNYLDVSISWELGFDNYELYLSEGSRNIADCKKVEEEVFKKADAALRANDGNGRYEGKAVYRKIVDQPLPLGIGLTETPAADVKGVATNKTAASLIPIDNKSANIDDNVKAYLEEITQKHFENIASKQLEISQIQKNTVNKNENHNKIMKITKTEDITDEALKEVKASEVTEFLKSEMKKASDAWETEKSQKDTELKAAQEQVAKNAEELTKLNATVEALNKTVKEFQDKEAVRATAELFTARMASLDESFNLTDEDRKALGPDIKGLNTDEEFASYRDRLKVIMSAKLKCQKTIQASETSKPDTSVADALKNATPTTPNIPNSTATTPKTLKEKYADAFAINKGINVKYRK